MSLVRQTCVELVSTRRVVGHATHICSEGDVFRISRGYGVTGRCNRGGGVIWLKMLHFLEISFLIHVHNLGIDPPLLYAPMHYFQTLTTQDMNYLAAQGGGE